MKAVITVIGQDKIGIIHQVTSVLTEYDGYQPDDYAGCVYHDDGGGYFQNAGIL